MKARPVLAGRVPVEPLARIIAALRVKGHGVATIAVHSGICRGEIRRIAIGDRGWVRPSTAEGVARAWMALKDRPPSPLGTTANRMGALDAADHSGRSASQVAQLTGLSVRTVKRRRAERRAEALSPEAVQASIVADFPKVAEAA